MIEYDSTATETPTTTDSLADAANHYKEIIELNRKNIEQNAQPIDEIALRSSRFRGGEPITLGGQTFYLPKPRIRFRPTFVDGKLIENRPSNDLGPDFAKAMEELDGDDDEASTPFLDRLMMVGAALILFNYDLSDEQLGELLTYESGSEDNVETWNAIVGTARGTYSPKVTTGLSGSPS